MMMVTGIEEYVIYESPDGGKTIYARTSGQEKKILVCEGTDKNIDLNVGDFLEILQMAETNTAMYEELKRLKTLYLLIKDE